MKENTVIGIVCVGIVVLVMCHVHKDMHNPFRGYLVEQ